MDRSIRLAVLWGRVEVLGELIEKREQGLLMAQGWQGRAERVWREDQLNDDLQVSRGARVVGQSWLMSISRQCVDDDLQMMRGVACIVDEHLFTADQ